jgi:hypothetical protein
VPSALRQPRLAVTPHATVAFLSSSGSLVELSPTSGEPLPGAPPMCVPEGGDVLEAARPLPLCSARGWTEAWGAALARLPNGMQTVLACRCAACSLCRCDPAV